MVVFKCFDFTRSFHFFHRFLFHLHLPFSENWTFDLKMDREFEVANFRVIPYLEIYNLTNRKNVVYVDPYTGKPDFSFGRTYEYAANPENWGPPRIIYLGLIMKY